MSLKKLLLLIVASLVAFAIDAQVVASGTVYDENNEEVIGATVVQKGKPSNGTSTDFDGKFTLNVPNGAHLVITYMGYEPTEVAAKSGLKITLKPKDDGGVNLNEVVVTGYQKVDKRLFTGATTAVDASKAKLDGVADVSRSLEGRAAGVSVQNVSGTFGTAPKIRVRGATSIYGSSKPLWVVDGVILEDNVDISADDLSSGDATTLIASAVAGLNADDIESFQILKDGSATSIYGAKANAGVIVITTKTGRKGHTQISYTGEFTYRLKPNYRDFNISNSQEQMGIYREMEQKGWLEMSNLINGSSSGVYGQMYRLMDQYNASNGQFGLENTRAAMNDYLRHAEMLNTNWFDLLFNNNILQNHAVSISGGTDKGAFYTSVSLMNDPGFTEAEMFRLTTDDLPAAQSTAARPLDEVLNELDEFIGMRSVKNSIRRLAVQSMFMKQRAAMGAGKVQQLAMNFVLTGNPGTGKTSIARKMGEILQSMDILPTSRVIEASRATLVGKYMGETPKIVNSMCDKAMGGILFIDEAYTLSDQNDQYGKEAIDTLMKRMEDDRGKFVVIAAGYKDKMEEFMQMNAGLASRFTHKLHIDDYNEDELLAIYKKMAQKDAYILSPTAEFKALDVICKMIMMKDETFGNAREMRNLLDETVQQLSVRVSNLPPDQVTKETYQLIEPEDIPDKVMGDK